MKDHVCAGSIIVLIGVLLLFLSLPGTAKAELAGIDTFYAYSDSGHSDWTGTFADVNEEHVYDDEDTIYSTSASGDKENWYYYIDPADTVGWKIDSVGFGVRGWTPTGTPEIEYGIFTDLVEGTFEPCGGTNLELTTTPTTSTKTSAVNDCTSDPWNWSQFYDYGEYLFGVRVAAAATKAGEKCIVSWDFLVIYSHPLANPSVKKKKTLGGLYEENYHLARSACADWIW